MTNEHTLVPESPIDEDLLSESLEDQELETLAELHRAAALHFSQAAKHHTLAADADDHGHYEDRNTHSFLAYRHQLVASQYAEMAVMEGADFEDDMNESVK